MSDQPPHLTADDQAAIIFRELPTATRMTGDDYLVKGIDLVQLIFERDRLKGLPPTNGGGK